MASDQTVLSIVGKAMWNTRPTETDLEAKQLGAVLGYPMGWRVVRTIEEMEYWDKDALQNKDSLEKVTSDRDASKDAAEKEDTQPATEGQKATEGLLTVTNVPQTAKELPQIAKDKSQSQAEVEPTTKGPQSATETSQTVADTPASTSKNDNNAIETTEEKSSKVDEIPTTPKTRAEESIVSTQDVTQSSNEEPENMKSSKSPNTTTKSSSEPIKSPPQVTKVNAIVDRIYAGKPGTGCDMWYNHAAAIEAAKTWMEKEAIREDPDQSSPAPTPFDCKGGHLLPRVARFDVGDKVQVIYNDDWFDAKIMRRKAHAKDGFRYQVYYSVDRSKQSGVAERSIRPKESSDDPRQTAIGIGLDETWQAFPMGSNRWKIIGPDGTVYKSKKLALQIFNKTDTTQKESAQEEDPPWRTVGSEYLGKSVRWVTKHKASARRTVSVEQTGEVVGWISESDVDKAGNPGYVSEKSGKPAALYHVAFSDEPSLHPYGSVLVEYVDLEEFELKECIEENSRPNKKARL